LLSTFRSRLRRQAEGLLKFRERGLDGRTLSRPDRPDFVFAFHDDAELGPRILARIAKHTGLTPSDL
jgi:hypothetical protein